MRREIICIGGANTDVKAKAAAAMVMGSSSPGSIVTAPGGVARNIACNLARLGLPVALIAAVGADAEGEALTGSAAAAGVDVSLMPVCPGKSGSYVAILDAAGELLAAVNSMEIVAGLTPALLAGHADRLAAARYLVIDCNLPRESLGYLLALPVPVMVEPVSVAKCGKLAGLDWSRIHLLTPNRQQAEVLAGLAIATPADAVLAARALRDRGVRYPVIALGAAGAASPEGVVAAFSAEATDVTGAGDAAAAGLLFGLYQGRSLLDAMVLGQAAAALAVQSPEAAAADLSAARLLSLAGPRMSGG